MAVKSPPSSFILSPNNNFSNRIKRKMTYRSKRSNKNNPEGKESPDISNVNNKDDNNKDNNIKYCGIILGK